MGGRRIQETRPIALASSSIAELSRQLDRSTTWFSVIGTFAFRDVTVICALLWQLAAHPTSNR